MIKHSEEFKQETVRIAMTSGLLRGRVASDLRIWKLTLGKWLALYRHGSSRHRAIWLKFIQAT
jgi:transposase